MNRIGLGWLFLGLMQGILSAGAPEIWTSAELQADLPARLSLDWEQELRLDDGGREFNKVFSEITLKRKLGAGISLLGAGRYIFAREERRQRLSLGGTWKHKYGFLEFQSRVKLQREFRPGRDPADEFRTLLGLERRLFKRFHPEFTLEGFHKRIGGGWVFDETRWTAELGIRFTADTRLKVFYTHKRLNLSRSKSGEVHILGFKYVLKI